MDNLAGKFIIQFQRNLILHVQNFQSVDNKNLIGPVNWIHLIFFKRWLQLKIIEIKLPQFEGKETYFPMVSPNWLYLQFVSFKILVYDLLKILYRLETYSFTQFTPNSRFYFLTNTHHQILLQERDHFRNNIHFYLIQYSDQLANNFPFNSLLFWLTSSNKNDNNISTYLGWP